MQGHALCLLVNNLLLQEPEQANSRPRLEMPPFLHERSVMMY
jgi:hypothetical protein